MAKNTNSISLKAAEARTQDVGRGLARMDPNDINRLQISVGDIIELEGKRKTAAKVMPAFAEDREKEIIQIDGITRENAQISLDEKVEIRKAAAKPAIKVILSPINIRSLHSDRDTRYIGRLLEGLPLMAGDRVRANLFGTNSCDFRVMDTIPKGTAVILQTNTLIAMKEVEVVDKRRDHKISYEDIGGLTKEIQRIREMIELPLKYPQLFERLGIAPPKGVFLYGPPGCGKTLIARAVANETDAYFSSISGPEIMGKFYGESEGRLRNLFSEAQANAPSIIFLDEVESIAPKREDMGAEKQVERRVVAQLLSLMDGLASRGQVIVIAATNIPNAVDPALRRPGRFDREISIPIPDRNARLEIIQIHTRGMPLADNVNLEKLASITHGFVGADLEALAREAAMTALRKMLPKIDFDLEEIPYETLLELEVNMEEFLEALKEIGPSAIREVFVEVPDVKWGDVGGLQEVKETLKEAVEWPLKFPEVFDKAKTHPPKGILLHGPPGTGKTLIAKAVASESEVNFISISGPSLMNRYVGESERGVREAFKKAKQASPCILFFDEIDALVPERGSMGNASGSTERVISQFLVELDGIEELKGVLVLAATNRIDIIDPAVLRAGRFDMIIEMPIPDQDARLEILAIHTKNKPLAHDVNLKELARELEGWTGADLEAMARRTSLLAIREFIEKYKGKHGDKEIGGLVLKKAHFEEVIPLIKAQKIRLKGKIN